MSTVRLAQWVNGFDVHSASSTRVYRISEKVIDGVPSGFWACSCPGCKSHGHCKHLTAAGKTPVPRNGGGVRREPVSEEARERQRARTRAAFSDAAYEHFDPSMGSGFGSYEDWADAADAADKKYAKFRRRQEYRQRQNSFNGFDSYEEWEEAAKRAAAGAGRKPRPPVHPDLRALGLKAYPEVAAELTAAMRRKARELHPDLIEEHRACPGREHGKAYKTCKHEDKFTSMMAAYDRLLGQYTGKVA